MTSFLFELGLIHFVFRLLNALQFVQKDFESDQGDNKLFNVVANWIVLLTNIFGDDQFSGAEVVIKALSDQERPLRELCIRGQNLEDDDISTKPDGCHGDLLSPEALALTELLATLYGMGYRIVKDRVK